MIGYAGWLLHNYIRDKSPGVAAGQGLHSHGGHWYAVAPSGRLVMKHS